MNRRDLIGAAMTGAAGLAAAAAVVPSAHAQTPPATAGVGTLDRIIKDKKIRVTAEVTSPPFGILVFTVKAALPQENVSTGEIFRGSVPYWICLLAVIVVLAAFPALATWLPSLGR